MRSLKTLLPFVNIALIFWLLRKFSEEKRLAEIEKRSFETYDFPSLAEAFREKLLSLEQRPELEWGKDLFENDEVGVVYSVKGILPAELEKLNEAISKISVARKDLALVANDKESSFSELKLSNTIVHSIPDELLLADELASIVKAASKNKESAAFAFHLMLVHALQPKILVNVNSRNVDEVLKLVPKISEKAESWSRRKDWALLILGREESPAIQVVHPRYITSVAQLSLFAPEIDSNHLVIKMIDLKMCPPERQIIGVRNRDPFSCAKNSGLVRYDLY